MTEALAIALHEAIERRTKVQFPRQAAVDLSNFDCFHYAYTKASGSPMLTTDRLLKATDLLTSP